MNELTLKEDIEQKLIRVMEKLGLKNHQHDEDNAFH